MSTVFTPEAGKTITRAMEQAQKIAAYWGPNSPEHVRFLTSFLKAMEQAHGQQWMAGTGDVTVYPDDQILSLAGNAEGFGFGIIFFADKFKCSHDCGTWLRVLPSGEVDHFHYSGSSAECAAAQACDHQFTGYAPGQPMTGEWSFHS